MATMITSECINCGACEPECPNTAIYQGGVAWDFNGQTHPALSNDIFYIVPEKCTECVGFHDQEACAAVCPVDCCVPDPKYPETDAQLLARAKELHPGTDFPPDYPSRFKQGNGEAPAAVADAPVANGQAPAAASAPAAPAAAVAVAAAAPQILGARVERPLSPPPKAKAPPRPPMALKEFSQDLLGTYEDAFGRLGGKRGETRWIVKAAAFVTSPVLGALPIGQKKVIENAVGDTRAFSAAGATGFNILQNMILYPLIACAVAVMFMGKQAFSFQLTSPIVIGIAIASFEAMIRMREGLSAMPMEELRFRGALYGIPLSLVTLPLVTRLRRTETHGSIVLDGFSGGGFETKTERERRYGEVYALREEANGYVLRFEFPRHVPKSAAKEQLGIDDEMPDYDYDLSVSGSTLVVKGSIRDPNVRKLAAVSPAFPPDFTTNIQLSSPVIGFKHRIEDHVLEVVLLKS